VEEKQVPVCGAKPEFAYLEKEVGAVGVFVPPAARSGFSGACSVLIATTLTERSFLS
jgi:hypothetical protein